MAAFVFVCLRVAATPVNLIAQRALLPAYLRLLLGQVVSVEPVATVVLALIVGPLVAAWGLATDRGGTRTRGGDRAPCVAARAARTGRETVR